MIAAQSTHHERGKRIFVYKKRDSVRIPQIALTALPFDYAQDWLWGERKMKISYK